MPLLQRHLGPDSSRLPVLCTHVNATQQLRHESLFTGNRLQFPLRDDLEGEATTLSLADQRGRLSGEPCSSRRASAPGGRAGETARGQEEAAEKPRTNCAARGEADPRGRLTGAAQPLPNFLEAARPLLEPDAWGAGSDQEAEQGKGGACEEAASDLPSA